MSSIVTKNVDPATVPTPASGKTAFGTNLSSDVFIKDDTGAVTVITSGGTVTSVGVSSTDSTLSVSGSPVTTSGVIDLTVNEANLDLANIGGDLDLTTQVGTSVLPIANGGTGQATANAALNALLPSQATNNGKVLGTDGTDTSWVDVGTPSPLTTKGDLYTYTTTEARLPVGTDGQILAADSAEASGLKWIAAPDTSPAGSNTQVQFNNSGVFGASGSLTFNDGTNTLSVGADTGAGNLNIGDGRFTVVTDDANTTISAVDVGPNTALMQFEAESFNIVAAGATAPIGVNVSASGSSDILLSTSSGTGDVRFQTAGTQFEISTSGTWSIDSDVGTSGQVLTSQGAGSPPVWSTVSAAPGGSTGQVQFNNAGAFSGDADLTWDTTGNTLSVGNAAASGNLYVGNALLADSAGTTSIAPSGDLNIGTGGASNIIIASGPISGDLTLSASAGDLNVDVAGALVVNSNAGTSGQVLTSQGAGSPPVWSTISGGSAAGSTGQVQFNTSGAFDASSGMVFDESTPGLKALGVGTDTGDAGVLALGDGGTTTITGDGSTIQVAGATVDLSAGNDVTLNATTGDISLGTAGVDVVLSATGELLIDTDPGTSGYVLTSQGAGSPPVWAAGGGGGSSSNTYKEAVRAATTANITLSGNVSMDGITTAPGDRILVKNQSSASQNGIYIADSGAWTRASDFDTTGAEVSNGAIIPVQFGTVNGGSTWQLVQNGGTIGNSFRFAPVNGAFSAGMASINTPNVTGLQAVGFGNGAQATGSNGTAIGSASVASGTGSTAVGVNSTASSTYACSFGYNATAGGVQSVALGIGSSASGSRATAIGGTSSNDWTFCAGRDSAATHAYSAVIGSYGRTSTVSEVAFGGGEFSTTNTASTSVIRMWYQTSDDTATELKGGSANSNTPSFFMTLSNDSSYIFDCDIIARNTGDDTESKAWNLKFAIRRGTSAANTALIGSATKTVIGEDTGTSGWDVGVTADTTNGRPKIEVTGEASKTIRWVAHIRMTKVTG